MNRPLLTPQLIARLIGPLTAGETMELTQYAAEAEGQDEFAYRASEWLIRHYGLTMPDASGRISEDVQLVVKRILPLEHE